MGEDNEERRVLINEKPNQGVLEKKKMLLVWLVNMYSDIVCFSNNFVSRLLDLLAGYQNPLCWKGRQIKATHAVCAWVSWILVLMEISNERVLQRLLVSKNTELEWK
jgi:hypothetical protein